MAHANQERYSALVDAKLRATLVTRDGAIFNTRYEGSPKAGKVKIPVRDTEVAVKAYDKANGVDADAGTTTYLDLDIDNDEAVNEIIDGFDAASVPDGITAERLDSAAYSMALSIDKKSIEALQSAAGATISATKTACTASTAYKEALAAKRTLSRNGVPQTGRFMIVSPEYLEILMQDDKFIKQGDLSQQLVQTGAVGQIAGFAVYESNNIISAILAGAVTLIGVLIANSRSQAVTDTKLEELTREVREHNNFARRVPILEEQMKVANHRIADLEADEHERERN